MNTVLEDRIRHTVEGLPVPVPDLDRVVDAGRRIRRRRTAGTTLAVAAATGIVAAGALAVAGPGEPRRGDGALYASVGPLDATHGLRAYAAPAAEIHVGGRTFPIEDMGYLDTDATTTNQGVVFFDSDHRPRMLAISGDVVTLGPVPPSAPGDWHPSAKADSAASLVALTQPTQDGIEVQVVDVEQRAVLATRDVPCSGEDCGQVVVDAFDDDIAWVRTPEGTRMWDGGRTWELVSGPETRIADVRNRVVLFDATTPAPELLPEDWRAVPGAIDAQLTFDGGHVLSWSSRLEPTTPGAAPIVLDQGPTSPDDGLAWWNLDTDGSVLVAVASSPERNQMAVSTVYDCEVPSGHCTRLGGLTTEHGDPMFIGNDM